MEFCTPYLQINIYKVPVVCLLLYIIIAVRDILIVSNKHNDIGR